MPIQPSSFAVHLTYTCPLACAHCCFNSSPDVKDTLAPETVLEAIRHLPEDMEMIAFTGGEPFLHGAHLVDYVVASKKRALRTRVVTSAYFARSPAIAIKRLKPLADAGLDELSISWDDYHEEFVDFSCVKNLILASLECGIYVAISSVQEKASRWTVGKIRSELGSISDKVEIVTESGLNLTGRAEAELADSEFNDEGYLGPCPYVITGPTLSAKNNLLACCGVIPNTDRLILGKNPDPSEYQDLIEASKSDDLLTWLFLRGPYDLLEKSCQKTGTSVPPREQIGGNCEACKLVLDSGKLQQAADRYASENAIKIRNEAALLETLGLLTSKGVVDLWNDTSRVRRTNLDLS